MGEEEDECARAMTVFFFFTVLCVITGSEDDWFCRRCGNTWKRERKGKGDEIGWKGHD